MTAIQKLKTLKSNYAEMLESYLINGDTSIIDMMLKLDYGNIITIHCEDEVDKAETDLSDRIFLLLYTNEYKYSNYIKSMELEFNPLWNVDGTETITVTKTGTEADAGSNSKTIGAQTTSTSNTYGAQSNSAGSTNKTYPYDDPNTAKNESSVDSTETIGSRSDTGSIQSGQRSDSGTDSNTHTYNTTESTTHVRSGNIGVTTTTKLLTEFREYVSLNFCRMVAIDIVDRCTSRVWR